MIQSFTVINETGEFLVLELRSPEKSGFFVRKIDGLGPVKSIINTSESLYGDGGVFNSSRLAQRNIILDLGFYNDGQETMEEIRNKSYRFFPMKRPLTFVVTTDTRVGIATGFVETNDPDIFSKEESAQISLLCPDPFFYGNDIIETTFSGITNNFEFPFENPSLTEKLIEFGLVFINTNANVFYSGDSPTGVIFYINFLGSVNDLTIIDYNSGESMPISSDKLITLTGSDFVIGDQVIISTIKGNKFIILIRGGNVINILNTIDINATWFTIDKGDNVFTYTADSGLSNVQFRVEHRVVYEGV